jgi:hypothetical protein
MRSSMNGGHVIAVIPHHDGYEYSAQELVRVTSISDDGTISGDFWDGSAYRPFTPFIMLRDVMAHLAIDADGASRVTDVE